MLNPYPERIAFKARHVKSGSAAKHYDPATFARLFDNRNRRAQHPRQEVCQLLRCKAFDWQRLLWQDDVDFTRPQDDRLLTTREEGDGRDQTEEE